MMAGSKQTLLVMMLVISLVACSRTEVQIPAADELLPVIPPDLAEMGAGVQKQYHQLRDEVASREAEDPSSKTELGKAWGQLGMWHQVYDYPETGLYCYQRAQSLDPENARWPYYQAQILYLDGNFEAARTKYQEVLALEPGRLGALLRLAELELENRHTDLASDLYQRVLELDPDSAPAQFGLGRIALQQEETDVAIEYLESASSTHPSAARIQYHLAMAYRELGDLERAQHHLEQVPETNRHQLPLPLGESWDRELNLMDQGPGAFRQRAMQARRLQNEGLATELFGRALAADPRNTEMKIAYARSLDRIGRTTAALEILEDAIRSTPDHPGLHVLLGTILAQKGQRQRADELLARAVQLDPDCLRCRRALAVLLGSLGRHQEGLEHLEFLRANHVSAVTAFSHAVTLIHLGRSGEALAALEADRKLLPEDDSIRLLEARLLAAGASLDSQGPGRAAELIAMGPIDTLMAAETKAMVEAANGNFDLAVDWQQVSIEATISQPKQVAHRTRRRLDLYQDGRPCLQPWERGERNLAIPVTPPPPRSPPAAR